MDVEEAIPCHLRRSYWPFLENERISSETSPHTMQQDFTSKPFFDDVTKGGLDYAYAKCTRLNPRQHYRKRTSHSKHVVIVGGGLAGLSAAYELCQAGHQVTILELQNRIGGRAKTIKSVFADGLHAEGGAMRLPESHYLTKHYIDLFDVPTRTFQNYNANGYLCFYGDKVKMADWQKDPEWYCNKYWSGWNDQVTPPLRKDLHITGINSYFDRTVAPVIAELRKDQSAKGWARWVKKWSKMSVIEFLKSDEHQDVSSTYKLRPWPQKAIDAYRVRNYMPLIRASLVEYLRELFGNWWKEPLYTPKDGMESLPQAFTRKNKNGWNPDVELRKNIHYGINVEEIAITRSGGQEHVTVKGRNQTTKQPVEFEGDAVLVTVPLTVMRNMKIPLSLERQQAVEGIHSEASTKIILQCRTRFWQKPDNLQGGFSKTNLPIGQLHYPDWEESGIPATDRGILVIYTWSQEAEAFGAQTPDEAIANAVKQVATIHPEILEQFEVGAVQAWFNEPSTQGAFVYLHPDQYNDSLQTLFKQEHPIYLAGDGISWSNGWIQGAMESGLRAAYQFYCHNESQYPPENAQHICPNQYPQEHGPHACPSQYPQEHGPHTCPSQYPQEHGPHACPSQYPQEHGPHTCPNQYQCMTEALQQNLSIESKPSFPHSQYNQCCGHDQRIMVGHNQW